MDLPVRLYRFQIVLRIEDRIVISPGPRTFPTFTCSVPCQFQPYLCGVEVELFSTSTSQWHNQGSHPLVI